MVIGKSLMKHFTAFKARYRKNYLKIQVNEPNTTGFKRSQDWLLENLGATYSSREGYLLAESKLPKLEALESAIDKAPWQRTQYEHWMLGMQFHRTVTPKIKLSPAELKAEMRDNHLHFVKTALQEGENVPDHVLADYPEFQTKAV